MCSLGIPFDFANPKLQEAVDKVASAAKAAWNGDRKVFVGLGGLMSRPDVLKKIITEDKHGVVRSAVLHSDRCES